MTPRVIWGTTNSNDSLTHGNLYFQVNDAFCVSNAAGQSATIEIEYYDNVAGANIRVQYDSTASFNTTGSGG